MANLIIKQKDKSNQIELKPDEISKIPKGIYFKGTNTFTPYTGPCTSSTDGTFMVGSINGTTWPSGLAIGGSSGNLLWKNARVVTETESQTLSNKTIAGAKISSHLYLVGASATSSTGNKSQIVFGTLNNDNTVDQHISISSNKNALVLNPSISATETSNPTAKQIVLYLNNNKSKFPYGIEAGSLTVNGAVEMKNTVKLTADSDQVETVLEVSGKSILKHIETMNITPYSDNVYEIGNQNKKFSQVHATTFYGALSGNATTASKLNTNAGANNNPIYFSEGVPVASTLSLGSATKPIYLSGGVFTEGTQLGSAAYQASNNITSVRSNKSNYEQIVLTWDNSTQLNYYLKPNPDFPYATGTFDDDDANNKNHMILGSINTRTWDRIYASRGIHVVQGKNFPGESSEVIMSVETNSSSNQALFKVFHPNGNISLKVHENKGLFDEDASKWIIYSSNGLTYLPNVGSITISNTSFAEHIKFSRNGLNFITATGASASINFVVGNSTVNSDTGILSLFPSYMYCRGNFRLKNGYGYGTAAQRDALTNPATGTIFFVI